jgi:subtilisin family serine protease
VVAFGVATYDSLRDRMIIARGAGNGGAGFDDVWELTLVVQIEADKVWNLDGKRGEGIVVASGDTGVEWTHPALKGTAGGTARRPATISTGSTRSKAPPSPSTTTNTARTPLARCTTGWGIRSASRPARGGSRTAADPAGGSGTVNDVIAGDLATLRATSLFATAVCLGASGVTPQRVDPVVPPAGSGTYYVVQARNVCSGSGFGATSSGAPRVHASCP